jgi:hypothetical protein
VTREGSLLRIKPCVPVTWTEFEIATQFGSTRYEIKLTGVEGGADDLPPDVQCPSPGEFVITLKDDGGVRRITLPLAPVEPKQ